MAHHMTNSCSGAATRIAWALILALIPLAQASADQSSAVRIEKVMAMPDEVSQLVISPDGQRVAMVVNRGSRQVVIVDGQAGPEFDSIDSRGGNRGGHRGHVPLKFSADSRQVTYLGVRSNRFVLMVGGHEVVTFDRVFDYVESPFGSDYAIAVVKSGGSMTHAQILIIRNGKTVKEYSGSMSKKNHFVFPQGGSYRGELRLSPDGHHLLFAESKTERHSNGVGTNRYVRVQINGVATEWIKGSSQISYLFDNAGRFRGFRETKRVLNHFIVIDGQVIGRFKNIGDVRFARIGTGYAFSAITEFTRSEYGTKIRDYEWVAIVNGEPVESSRVKFVNGWPPISKALFSFGVVLNLDGSRFAFLRPVVTQPSKPGGSTTYSGWQIIDDQGNESQQYDAVGDLGFTASGDLMAHVSHNRQALTLINGDERSGSIRNGTFPGRAGVIVSNDEERVAYARSSAGSNPRIRQQSLIVDGEHIADGVLTEFTFSEDGAQYAAIVDGKLIIDGALVNGGNAAGALFGSHGTYAYREYTVVKGRDNVPGATVFNGRRLSQLPDVRIFGGPNWAKITPDGRHLVYMVRHDDGHYHVMMDDRPGPSFHQLHDPLRRWEDQSAKERIAFHGNRTFSHLGIIDGDLCRLTYAVDTIDALPTVEQVLVEESLRGFSDLYSFSADEKRGAVPLHLVQRSDGSFIGTAMGGRFNNGVIYSLSQDGTDYTVLYEFAVKYGQGFPTSLALAPDGTVVGTTGKIRRNGHDTIFRFDPSSGECTTIYEHRPHSRKDEAYRVCFVDVDGMIYGAIGHVVFNTGIFGSQLFALSPDGSSMNVIHDSRPSPQQNNPTVGAFINGGDGWLYGVSESGGPFNSGYLLRIAKDGRGFESLHEFAGAPDGGKGPQSAIVLRNGALYGVTSEGGADNKGTVWMYRDGAFTVLHNIEDHLQGLKEPYALTASADGLTLYGLCLSRGGTRDKNVTLFSMDAGGGQPKELVNKAHPYNPGRGPGYAPFLGQEGALYGVGSSLGGANGKGFIYRFVPPSMEGVFDPRGTFDDIDSPMDVIHDTLVLAASGDIAAASSDRREEVGVHVGELTELLRVGAASATLQPDLRATIAAFAEAGIPEAQLLIGQSSLAYDGMRIGSAPSEAEIAALQSAAEADLSDAYLFLGELCGQGKIGGGAVKAVVLFERGHELGSAECTARLAFFLMIGRGVETTDPRRTDGTVRKLLRSAASRGSGLGAYMYAEHLAKGIQGSVDTVAANRFYQQAAWLGHPLGTKWFQQHEKN